MTMMMDCCKGEKHFLSVENPEIRGRGRVSTHTSLNGAGRISLRRLWEEGCSAFFAPRTSIYEKLRTALADGRGTRTAHVCVPVPVCVCVQLHLERPARCSRGLGCLPGPRRRRPGHRDGNIINITSVTNLSVISNKTHHF